MRSNLPDPRAAQMFGMPVRWAGAVLCVTLILICSSFVLLLWNARAAERQKASTAASNVSAALAQDIARNIQLYDLTLQGVLEGLADPAVMSVVPDVRQRVLFGRTATAPYLGSVIVENESGDVLFDSASPTPRSQNYSDRAYFKAQKAHPDLGLFISEPFTGKVDREWVINLSRRISKSDGSFGGVVAGTLRLEYFHRLFARMKLGPGGALTLFRTDGTLMMREPYDPTLVGQIRSPAFLGKPLAEAPEGEYEGRSVIDGVDRLFHYQRVGDLPLVLNVASSIKDIYADWWLKAAGVTAMLATACAIIVSLALILKTELRRRVLAEARLVTLAEEDPLTRLANRRRFDGALAEEVHRAVRHGLPLSLLMIDADHFKSYNDAFGHVAGDAALVALADCLAQHARRPGDLAARYGGEEFAVILPHAAAAEALAVGEAIRRGIRDLGLQGPASQDGIFSVSVGIASVVPRSGEEANDIVEAADAALYRSKAEGRDRSTLVGALGLAADGPAAPDRSPNSGDTVPHCGGIARSAALVSLQHLSGPALI